MKACYSARVILVFLICISLLSGCANIRSVLPGAKNPGTVHDENEELDIDASPGTAAGDFAVAEGTAEGAAGTTEIPGEENEENAETVNTAEEKTPPKVKALYLTGWTAGGKKNIEYYVELANTTEINSYVVDIKDDDGYVGYESEVEAVKENGTWKKKYDPDYMLEAFHDNGIYVIGRLVAFKDPVYSIKRPDLAIKNKNGGLWKDNKGMCWLNPYNKENWEYLISIAKEAVAKGFDEIQFDYVRFPSDGKKANMDFSGIEQEKYEAINEFLAYAKAEIPEVPISADIFAITLESPADTEDIGQYLEYIGMDIDYISPMAYPSHYAYGQIINKIRFDAPDLDPYGVVYNTLVKGKDRIAKVEGYKAKVRPYLQAFTASWLKPRNGRKMYQKYGAEQMRQQIKAVYDAGYEEWIFWDPSNKYSVEAFEKETGETLAAE
ncbi:MAG: putative glycoside hydrolase [Acetivibrionales bacterium]|jgi:hypothetical protein